MISVWVDFLSGVVMLTWVDVGLIGISTTIAGGTEPVIEGTGVYGRRAQIQ